MGRRSEARKLNLATQQEREEEFNAAEWLLKPKQKATREEVYALLRQYHWEHGRAKLRSRSPVVRFLYAVLLVVTFPVRAVWSFAVDQVRKRRRKDDLMLAKQLRIQARELGVEIEELAQQRRNEVQRDVLDDHSERNTEEGPDGA